MRNWLRLGVWCLLAMVSLAAAPAHASISLLLEEPFGAFGAINPTGHAAVYLSNVCAETPTQLRRCHAGEMGVVISRYHRVHGYDWIAVPLIPYLYAVDDLSDVPESVTPGMVRELRDAYRREHLQDVAPDARDGGIPRGEWVQLVGSSYDRRIFGFQLTTTEQQDDRLIAMLNDGHNHSHFNLFYRNCADFSRSLFRTTYPGSIPRNALADFFLTTPKHLARSITKFGTERPEVEFQTFQIPQVPGTVRRSHKVAGIAESLVRSKKYLVPLAFLSPTTAASLVAAYVSTGRFVVPKDAPVMSELVPMPAGISLEGIALPAEVSAVPAMACTPVPVTAPVASDSMVSGGGE